MYEKDENSCLEQGSANTSLYGSNRKIEKRDTCAAKIQFRDLIG